MIYNSMWSSSKTYRIYKDSGSYKLIYKEFGGEQIERENSTLNSNSKSDLSEKNGLNFNTYYRIQSFELTCDN